jgi:hypothetical protein
MAHAVDGFTPELNEKLNALIQADMINGFYGASPSGSKAGRRFHFDEYTPEHVFVAEHHVSLESFKAIVHGMSLPGE